MDNNIIQNEKDIIAAVECCSSPPGCERCPHFKPSMSYTGACVRTTLRNAFNLIQHYREEIEKLKSLVPPESTPVVHAKWINYMNGNATCSHCKVRQKAVYDDDNEQNYCGHCGAIMDGRRR